MASDSLTFRLYLTREDAAKAVAEAIAGGRTKFAIKEQGSGYFKVKQRQTLLSPLRLEIGLRNESADSTIVVVNGSTSWMDWKERGRERVANMMAKFQDDVESCASRYVRQA